MDIFDQKREKWYSLSLHYHPGERSFGGSGNFNSRQNFQDINDKTAEKNKSKQNSFFKAALGFNIA